MAKRLAPFALIAPAQLLLIAVIGLPAIYVLVLSFTHSTFGSQTTFAGLENYTRILSDPSFGRAFVNTFVVVNVVIYGELVLGLCAAFLFASVTRFKRLLFAVMLAPYSSGASWPSPTSAC